MAGSEVVSNLGVLISLLLSVAAAGFASYFLGGKLLKLKFFSMLPVPLICTALWMMTTSIFVLVFLGYTGHISQSDWQDALLLIPVAGVSGLIYGVCFLALKDGLKLDGVWWQRLLLGASIGLAVVLPVGFLLYTKSDRYWIIFMIVIVWLIPAMAVAGLLTPQRALIRVKG